MGTPEWVWDKSHPSYGGRWSTPSGRRRCPHSANSAAVGEYQDTQGATMSNQLLSVVIPTANRPQFLPRAVTSALHSAPDGNVEVIVVPNGPDESWQAVAESFQEDRRVRWEPISTAHANAARNHGLASSQGLFVRFLDDDDYLYPEASRKQCRALLDSDADMASGDVEVVSDRGNLIRTLVQPAVNDFVEGTLSPSRRSQQGGHLYRRELLDGLRWDERCRVGQDTIWMIQLAGLRELNWIKTPGPVAAWMQHRGTRVSRGRDPGDAALKNIVEHIQWAVTELDRQDRLTDERLLAASQSLWSNLQKGLRYDFMYWERVARIAEKYAPNCRPPSRIHRFPIARDLPPLVVETGLIPVRTAYHPVRVFLDAIGVSRV